MRVRGSGPTPSEWMMVSDYPGQKEDQLGVSLVGKTGEEVNRHLDGVNLPPRSEWFIDCLIKEWAGKDGEYTAADLERDTPEMHENLLAVRPKLICTLGRASARFFCGDVDLDEVNAMGWYMPPTWAGPRWWKTDADRPIVFPVYNPAAGFRAPDIQSKVWDGFRQLGFLLAEKTSPRELFHDDYAGREKYCRLTTQLEVSDKLYGAKDVHIDSEGLPGRTWSLQFAMVAGEGYLIRSTDKEALAAFFWGLQRWNPVTTYHGSLHDFAIMREFMTGLGIPLSILYDLRFDDTQIMAYVLQLEPIGLKPNGVRHCGMQMREYSDVIGDAQHIHATNYLVRLFDAEHKEWKARCSAEFDRINRTPLVDRAGNVRRDKSGAIRYRRIAKAPKLPMSPLHKAAKRVLNSANPFKLWQEQGEDVLVAAYNREVE